MLKELKFVQGAVAKKDFIPALTHFSIRNGVIKGFNGSLSLCAPIPIQLDVNPRAVPFVKAIQSCKGETVQLSVTPTGKLSIKAGKFKALVECSPESFPDVEPEGEWINLDGINILPPLKSLLAYTGEDASRKWAMGIMFRGSKAFATNNIIIMEYDLGIEFPVEINIPKTAVAELVRIGQPPIGMKLTDHSVTFMYSEHHWVKTQLYDLTWPDIEKVLNRDADYVEIQEEWFDAIETVSPFVDESNRVYFKDGTITTSTEGSAGGTIELEQFPYEGVYNYKYFLSLKGLVSHISLSSYPSPVLFKGTNVRGVIAGMRSE